MKTISRIAREIPEWAVYYLAYGEDESLKPEEITMIEGFKNKLTDTAKKLKAEYWDIDFNANEDANPHFTWSPPFGLACNVYDALITFNRKEI
jgi:hypothetical protein